MFLWLNLLQRAINLHSVGPWMTLFFREADKASKRARPAIDGVAREKTQLWRRSEWRRSYKHKRREAGKRRGFHCLIIPFTTAGLKLELFYNGPAAARFGYFARYDTLRALAANLRSGLVIYIGTIFFTQKDACPYRYPMLLGDLVRGGRNATACGPTAALWHHNFPLQ